MKTLHGFLLGGSDLLLYEVQLFFDTGRLNSAVNLTLVRK